MSVLLVTSAALFAQETTGGLQGTVKDATGAVVGGAHVVEKAQPSLATKRWILNRAATIDSPTCLPESIRSTVSATGFKTTKREGLISGSRPSPLGGMSPWMWGRRPKSSRLPVRLRWLTSPQLTNMTNVTADVIWTFRMATRSSPSFSLRPGPATNLLPALAGGTGGSMPGAAAATAMAFGYSIGGAADSENGYLIEGQDTEKHFRRAIPAANVPFEFIKEVEIKDFIE